MQNLRTQIDQAQSNFVTHVVVWLRDLRRMVDLTLSLRSYLRLNNNPQLESDFLS